MNVGNNVFSGAGRDIVFNFGRTPEKKFNTGDEPKTKTRCTVVCVCAVLVLTIWVAARPQDATLVLNFIEKVAEVFSKIIDI